MILNIKNLHFRFSQAANVSRNVLNGISLQTDTPKTIAIVGASGCGKSTFLRLLCGILQENETNILTGELSINGAVDYGGRTNKNLFIKYKNVL